MVGAQAVVRKDIWLMRLKKAGVTQTIIEAKVAEDGTVTLKGTIPRDAVNPIVLVNFRQ